jgi:hypothetical protein
VLALRGIARAIVFVFALELRDLPVEVTTAAVSVPIAFP